MSAVSFWSLATCALSSSRDWRAGPSSCFPLHAGTDIAPTAATHSEKRTTSERDAPRIIPPSIWAPRTPMGQCHPLTRLDQGPVVARSPPGAPARRGRFSHPVSGSRSRIAPARVSRSLPVAALIIGPPSTRGLYSARPGSAYPSSSDGVPPPTAGATMFQLPGSRSPGHARRLLATLPLLGLAAGCNLGEVQGSGTGGAGSGGGGTTGVAGSPGRGGSPAGGAGGSAAVPTAGTGGSGVGGGPVGGSGVAGRAVGGAGAGDGRRRRYRIGGGRGSAAPHGARSLHLWLPARPERRDDEGRAGGVLPARQHEP